MTLHHGDCLEVMAGMDPESVDAIVTDPPYGLEFMGKEWDRLGDVGKVSNPGVLPAEGWSKFGDKVHYTSSANVKCRACGHWQWSSNACQCERPDFPSVKAHQGRLMQAWHQQWAEAAYRVAKPSAYLLAFGGTRTVHRMTCALEDAGWIIRDMLVWGYASGFPKSKASLKPAWEPIVMARKPGPLRMLAIDECRIEYTSDADKAEALAGDAFKRKDTSDKKGWSRPWMDDPEKVAAANAAAKERAQGGRWPANIVLTDPILEPGVLGVYDADPDFSRFYCIPKAARSDREPVLGGQLESREWRGQMAPNSTKYTRADGQPGLNLPRENSHPTVKPVDLMRHLVRLVTPTGGTVLDPFLGSGTTALAAEMEGFAWIGIEREAEYVAIAEARLNGTQRGLGLGA